MEQEPVERVDARRLSADEANKKRLLVARLHQEGVPTEEIVRRTGLRPANVVTVIKKLHAGGMPALEPANRGRKKGCGRALTGEQELEVRECIRQRPPSFYGLVDATWRLATVSSLIESKFKVALSRRGVGGYLLRWGIHLKNPSQRPEMRCAAAVKEWWEKNNEKIRIDANAGHAEILWLNKPIKLYSGFWHPPHKPGSPKPKNRQLHLLSAIDDRGTLRWMIFKGEFTEDIEKRFVARLLSDLQPRLFLIRSKPQMYESSDFLSWVNNSKGAISIFPPLEAT